MNKRISLLVLIVAIVSGAIHARQANQFNLEKGDSFQSVSVMEQQMSQTVMGTEQNQSSSTTSTELYEVIEADPDTYLIKNTIQKMKTEVNSPMGSQTFDSEGTTPGDAAMKVMTGKSYEFRISKTGKILEINGLEEIVTAISEELAGTPMAAQAAQLSAGFTEESMKNTLNSIFTIYPDKPAQEWDRTREVELNGVPATISADYSWQNKETIAINGTVSVNGEMEQMGMKLNLNLSGAQNGTLKIDQDTGMITSAKSTGDVAGFVTTQGMEIPMSVTTTTTNTITKL